MFTVIYKPTLECDLKCAYCYVGLRRPNITPVDIEKGLGVFKRILDNVSRLKNKNVNVLFHGGEPLLMGEDFYKKCSYISKEYECKFGLRIKKCMQTNMVNFDKAFLSTLYEQEYCLSTSLDGHKEAHDYFRRDEFGLGTYDRVLANIRLAKSIGLKINAVCCLNSKNIDDPEKVYDIFNREGVNVKFNYLVSEVDLPKAAIIEPEQYATFISNITDIWLKDSQSQIDIMPSSDMINTLVNGRSESCIHANDCQKHFVCVGPDGDIWPCGKAVGMSELCFGNVADNYNGILVEEMRTSGFGKSLGFPPECICCEYFNLCKGLCPYENYIEHGSFNNLSKWCRAYRLLWSSMEVFVRRYRLYDLTLRVSGGD